jgi:hypothetical protein
VKVLRLSELNAETAVCTDLARNLQAQVLKFILVVLNIGYDLGILSGRIFAIMVLMAIFTTCMTRPLLTRIDYVSGKEAEKERSATIA